MELIIFTNKYYNIMISDSSENYSIGSKKYENLLKEILDDYNKYYKPIWVFAIGFPVFIILNLMFNGWISWNEILIRAALGTVIFAVAYLLGNGFPKKKISATFHPDNFPLIIQALKKYNHISTSKVIRSVLFYLVILLAIQVFAFMDTSDIISTLRDGSWKEGLLDFVVILVFVTVGELYSHYRIYARLKEIEQHIK